MTYDYTVKRDGQFYKPGQDVPDMGTLVCTSAQGNIRSYEGLAKDVGKLPRMLRQAALFWQVILAITINLKNQRNFGTKYK